MLVCRRLLVMDMLEDIRQSFDPAGDACKATVVLAHHVKLISCVLIPRQSRTSSKDQCRF